MSVGMLMVPLLEGSGEAAVKAGHEETYKFHRDLRGMLLSVFACFMLMCMSEMMCL